MENNLNTLMDIRDVQINLNNTLTERRKSYLQQIKDPYCFKYNDTVVKLQFSGDVSLEDRFIEVIKK